jgi:hypothetical protein
MLASVSVPLAKALHIDLSPFDGRMGLESFFFLLFHVIVA